MTRQEVIKAARKLFAAQGYEQTTVEKIAREARVLRSHRLRPVRREGGAAPDADGRVDHEPDGGADHHRRGWSHHGSGQAQGPGRRLRRAHRRGRRHHGHRRARRPPAHRWPRSSSQSPTSDICGRW
ncbi:helix-turn-helix domain-containing protein [Streptomyces sp. CA-243310]|uniref:helix-turn-helix domain-containing protein n=1 Tax=Streptomyces sp. CA-243310 TaxID=3240056 RepID=UPI003D90E8C7